MCVLRESATERPSRLCICVWKEREGERGRHTRLHSELSVLLSPSCWVRLLMASENAEVMNLMLTELKLEKHLRALRRYFFCEDGLWARCSELKLVMYH